MTELRIDPAAVEAAAEHVRALVDVRTDPAVPVLSPRAAGHPALAEALGSFGEAWQRGLEVLRTDADRLADGLDHAAAEVQGVDDYAGDVFKEAAVSFIGDPALSSEEIRGRSWAEHFGDLSTHGYTREEVAAMTDHNREAWSEVLEGPPHVLSYGALGLVAGAVRSARER